MCKKRKSRVPSRYDYLEYNRRKQELADKYGYGERYKREIQKLIDELGI
jgi:hypothetical protein